MVDEHITVDIVLRAPLSDLMLDADAIPDPVLRDALERLVEEPMAGRTRFLERELERRTHS